MLCVCVFVRLQIRFFDHMIREKDDDEKGRQAWSDLVYATSPHDDGQQQQPNDLQCMCILPGLTTSHTHSHLLTPLCVCPMPSFLPPPYPTATHTQQS